MDRARVESNALRARARSVGYDPTTRTIEIEFRDGTIYDYLPVPQDVFQQLISAPSKGSFFDRHIKLKYMYRAAE